MRLVQSIRCHGLVLVSLIFTALVMPPVRAESLDDRLWQALQAEDLEKIEAAINAGAFIDATDRRYYSPYFGTDRITPLMAAIEVERDAARHSIVSWLLENGADPNHRASDGSTPLIFAARFGDLALVTELIQAGADPNVQVIDNGYGQQSDVFWFAVWGGNPDVLEFFLNRGVSMSRDVDYQWSLLTLAASVDSPPTFSFLRDHAVGPAELDTDQRQELVRIASNNREERMLGYFIKTGLAQPLSVQERFVRALQRRQVDKVEELLKLGAAWDEAARQAAVESFAHDREGKMLDFFAGKGNRDILQEGLPGLVSQARSHTVGSGSKMNDALFERIRRVAKKYTLHGKDLGKFVSMAIDYNNRQLEQWVLGLPDIDVNYGSGGETPLRVALKKKRPELAKRLLELGAKANDEEMRWRREYLLNVACEHGYEELTEPLSKAGALIHISRDEENTVLECTVRRDLREMLQRLFGNLKLEYRRAIGFKLLTLAVKHDRPEIIGILLELGSPTKQTIYFQEENILAVAIQSGRSRIVKLLLESGMSPSEPLPDSSGKMIKPIELALAVGNDDIVRLLKTNGADVGR